MPPALVWFRQDLRLEDNPALAAALQGGRPVVPLFIWAPEEEGAWPPGAASRWWLHHSLAALQQHLEQVGSRLVIRIGPSLDTLRHVLAESGGSAVYWNHRYEPVVWERDAQIKQSLREAGIEAESFNAALLYEPWTVQNKAGRPFQVFTPFWRHCLALPAPPVPLPAPERLTAPARWPAGASLEQLRLLPDPDWAGGLRQTWQPGPAGARTRLEQFLKEGFAGYAEGRNRPDLPGTSQLSPHLHFGEISPRQIWHALRKKAEQGRTAAGAWVAWRNSQFVAELGWREFSHHLIYHFPHTDREPLRPEFSRFPWRHNPEGLRAWQRGQTGYPIVDAGMRELWTTGWMHNRVRMVVASFLVKDLLIPWQEGARWFWDTLVDADLAQNSLGWQWTAGCGADAAPFFRIFNPTAQGEKFDPQGTYIRRWVPELAALPDRWIHQPHAAPKEILDRAGVRPGATYPKPIVSHAIAREIALEAFARLKS